MTDVLTPEQRSRCMSRIRSGDTTPERVVRSVLHRLGYRFRLHRRDLPGRPDIVMPKHGAAIFVHGCFWHRHPGCRYATTPATRRAFWQRKFEENVKRDRKSTRALRRRGWRVKVVWECQTTDPERLARSLRAFLDR